MKKVIYLIFTLFFSQHLFAGGSIIQPGGKVILELMQSRLQAVALSDTQYIELLSKMGEDSISNVGEVKFDSNVWVDSLVIENRVPLIRSFSENGDELYFIGQSTLGKQFQMVNPVVNSDYERLINTRMGNQVIDLTKFMGGSTIQPGGNSNINESTIWQQIQNPANN